MILTFSHETSLRNSYEISFDAVLNTYAAPTIMATYTEPGNDARYALNIISCGNLVVQASRSK